MASTCVIGLLAVLLVLQPWIALSDFLAPLLSPVIDVCKEVECGQGTCKPSSNSTFLFECECHPGWTQTRLSHDDHLQFLPCVVPNCTVNYSCNKAPSPVQEKGSRANVSIFDPCHWTECGGGSCNRTSGFTYNCECAEGYYNILNVTAFACVQDCAIGMDCTNLGISSSHKSTSTAPTSEDSKNQASAILQGKSLWLITLMTFMAMIQWK
uniref:EGF-like domain-containing protein n=1 Tax=Fagus sylvatica TaxID=28930 RepID=A0A2N9F5C1_FAGSY